MKGAIRLGLILFFVCFISAGLLALVNSFTRGPIAEQARREQQEALAAVAPSATEFSETAAGRWDALASGQKVGEALSFTAKGYGGPISLMTGLDLEGSVTGVAVISQTETAGLGTRITEPRFLDQFIGKTARQIRLKKDDPANGAIDAITSATISSRAVTNALRGALDAR
jgi:Na+-translocating ferredoxin:NAD+ oxidoreductase subunit G